MSQGLDGVIQQLIDCNDHICQDGICKTCGRYFLYLKVRNLDTCQNCYYIKYNQYRVLKRGNKLSE